MCFVRVITRNAFRFLLPVTFGSSGFLLLFPVAVCFFASQPLRFFLFFLLSSKFRRGSFFLSLLPFRLLALRHLLGLRAFAFLFFALPAFAFALFLVFAFRRCDSRLRCLSRLARHFGLLSPQLFSERRSLCLQFLELIIGER